MAPPFDTKAFQASVQASLKASFLTAHVYSTAPEANTKFLIDQGLMG
jgi:hypothetical protein